MFARVGSQRLSGNTLIWLSDICTCGCGGTLHLPLFPALISSLAFPRSASGYSMNSRSLYDDVICRNYRHRAITMHEGSSYPNSLAT